MQLKGRIIEGDLVGKPLLTFSDELTMDAVIDISTKIEYMDRISNKVDCLLRDGHIRSILKNLDELQKVYDEYKQVSYSRKRNLQEKHEHNA